MGRVLNVIQPSESGRILLEYQFAHQRFVIHYPDGNSSVIEYPILWKKLKLWGFDADFIITYMMNFAEIIVYPDESRFELPR